LPAVDAPTMTSRTTGARFRQRKLSTKHALSIVREDEVLDALGYDENDPSRQIPRLETGVEKAEETEHHLQAVISASAAASLGGKVAQIYIPTPETKSSGIKYDELYPKRFSQPATYIRFSSTVEDCVGTPYCMTETDEKFLQTLNQHKGNNASDGEGKCSEDLFEEVMSFFEETAQNKQPYAAIDNAPVLPFEDMEREYGETISAEARKFAKDIYQHWQSLRLEKGNRSLMPYLKFETGQETDDADAYVCFRRREVRQARKTRGRDAQVVEKLKKLRRELEDARQLVHSINQREKLNMERYETEREVFKQRSELKRVKIQQGIRGEKGDDEELLVNQRPAPKPKTKTDASGQRPATLRLSTSRPEGRAPDNDLILLSEVQEEAAAAIQRAVDTKIGKHREWNRGFLDQTWNPITPPLDTASMCGYLPQVEEYQLPTPPASVRSGSVGDEVKDVEMKNTDTPTPVSDQDMSSKMMFRFASPPPREIQRQSLPAYRRRYGRGGRMHIEQRWPKKEAVLGTQGVVYDSDGESGDETVMYPMDYYDNLSLKYRASLLSSRGRTDPAEDPGIRRTSSDVAMGNAGSTASHPQQG